MAWYKIGGKKRSTNDYPKWEVKFDDFMTDDLAPYLNPHFEARLNVVRELVPAEHFDSVFVCGGLAANVAGITKEHGDIDLFVVDPKVFSKLAGVIKDNEEVVDRMGKREALDVQTVAYGKVLKFKFDDWKIDLVNFHDRITEPTLIGVLMGFDINWSMAGINLGGNLITIHKDALSATPMVSQERADIYLEGTLARIGKYRDRLVKTPDVDECDHLIAVTQNRLHMDQEKKTTQSQSQSNSPNWY